MSRQFTLVQRVDVCLTTFLLGYGIISGVMYWLAPKWILYVTMLTCPFLIAGAFLFGMVYLPRKD